MSGGIDDYIQEQQGKYADPNVDPNADPNVDPNADPNVDPNADPNVDPNADPNVDPNADPNVDPNADPNVDPNPEPQPGDDLDDEKLNSFFDTTGKTKEDIKSVYAQGAKYSEPESENSEISQQIQSLESENAELKKGLDPLSHFSSEQAYIAEQLRKKYPTMDPVAIQKAVGSDLSDMADLDVLALLDAVKRPGASGGEAMAKKILADEYGIDLSEPANEWDEMARAKLQRAAIDARHELKTFQKEVELPAIKSEEDLQQERARFVDDLKSKWDRTLPALQNFTKITVPGKEEGKSFEYEVPQEFRDGLGDYFERMIVNGELEPNDETVAFLKMQRDKDFIYLNLGNILAAQEANLKSSITKQTDDELNNTTPPNTQTAPGAGEELSGTEQHLEGQKGQIRY